MRCDFTKMHGCGNDYIYIDAGHYPLSDPAAVSRVLSDRHKSIGGDGVILVCPSTVADGKMRIFNIDGSEGKMCGNGIRCVAKFMYDHQLTEKTDLKIETLSGIKTVRLTFSGDTVTGATVDMGKAEFCPVRIPVKLPGDAVIGRTVLLAGRERVITCVSMGNPHCVIFGDDPATLDLEAIGPDFEHDPLFPERVNTEFIQVVDAHTLNMRVWERGSGETMACGTGACAAVSAAVVNGFCPAGEDVTVHLRGGDLVIRYTEKTVYMTGEAVTAFSGTVTIKE